MRKRDEPVRLTKIYTRGGDAGETSLGDGTRVPKTDARIAAGGEVDELNSVLGWALAAADAGPRVHLERIQNELFDLGADLSVPFADGDEKLRVTQEQIDRLERDCDEANAELEPLKSFVLPGGNEYAARLYLARAVCRRTERAVLGVADANPLVVRYLNRLSDLLFILARAGNAGGGETLWRPGGNR
jgi:cob(I)alamin adenosyltransferase